MSADKPGTRCGACRLGLITHVPSDPQCELRGKPRHYGLPRPLADLGGEGKPPKHRGEAHRCARCGRREDNHNVRHPFRYPRTLAEHRAEVAP